MSTRPRPAPFSPIHPSSGPVIIMLILLMLIKIIIINEIHFIWIHVLLSELSLDAFQRQKPRAEPPR